MLAAVALEVRVPWSIGRIVSVILRSPDDRGAIAAAAMLAGVVFVAARLVRPCADFLVSRLEGAVLQSYYNRCLKKIQLKPVEWHEARSAAAINQALSEGCDGLTGLVTAVLGSIMPIVLTFVLMPAMLFWKDPLIIFIFAAVIMTCIGMSAWVNLVYAQEASRLSIVANQRVHAFMSEVCLNIISVISWCAERAELEAYSQRCKTWADASLTTIRRLNLARLIISLVLILLLVSWLTIVMYQVIGGARPAADISVALLAFFAISIQSRSLITVIREAYVGADKLVHMANKLELYDFSASGEWLVSGERLGHRRGSVAFEGVGFAYPGSRDRVLKGVSFSLTAGERVAIVGASGGGKSSIVKLLQRFYEPTEGRIAIDGLNIAEFDPCDVRRAIATVPQDLVLFNRSIRENIAYGVNGPSSLEQIADAANRAGVSAFIEQLPDGYETMVLDGGANLSGGQRQRILIARALLAAAPILVLDEATSALDLEAEHWVRGALSRTVDPPTTIIIAHRLSAVRDVDRILVLDQGRIVEEGRHDDLLENGTYYKRLYSLWEGAEAPQ